MSLADFCTDVEKADKFKERALRVFELNEIEDVCDLQYTTSDKLEAAAILAAEKLEAAGKTVCLEHGETAMEPMWSHGVGAFIQRVFEKDANLRHVAEQLLVSAKEASMNEAPHGSMMEMLALSAAPKQPKVCVNLNAQVNGDEKGPAMGLAGLSLEHWPKADLVDSLATELARLKAKGVERPFIYTDVAQFLPGWCPKSYQEDEQEGAEEVENMMGKGFRLMAERLGAPKKVKHRLDVLRWSIAFDRFAIALAATGQLSYGKAMEHKALCQRVALEANEGRRHSLGVIYDEVARRAWEARARSGCAFDIESVAGKMEEGLLHDAKRAYDTSGLPSAGRSKGHPGSAGIVCHICGKSGHKANECWQASKGASKSASSYKGSGKAGQKGKGKGVQCHTCSMYGHKSDTCPNAAFHMVSILMRDCA